MFRCLTSLALLLLSVTEARAATWYTFNKNHTDSSLYFFDLDTVVKQGDTTAIWVKVVDDPISPGDGGIFATAIKYNYVCSKRSIQVLTSANYDKTGKFVRSFPDLGKISYAIPGSIGEGMLKTVCASDFPKNKSRDFYFQVEGNDIFKHTANYFEHQRAINTDPAPK